MAESVNKLRADERAQHESLLDAAREISAARLRVLADLREALLQDNETLALALARRLVGLYDEPTQKPS